MAHATARDGTARLLEDLAAEALVGGRGLEHRHEYDDATRTELMREAGLEGEAEAARVFRALMQREP